MDNECKQFETMLNAYVLAELPEKEAERVRNHLEFCPRCRKEFDEIKRILSAIREQPFIEPSPQLYRSVREAVHSRMENATKNLFWNASRFMSPFVRRPSYAAAAALILIAGFAVYIIFKPSQPPPPEIAHTIPEKLQAAGETLPELNSCLSDFEKTFESILTNENPREILMQKDPMVEVATAMKWKELLKGEEEYELLLSDIELIWRKIKGYEGNYTEQDIIEIRNLIETKEIIKQIKKLYLTDPDKSKI